MDNYGGSYAAPIQIPVFSTSAAKYQVFLTPSLMFKTTNIGYCQWTIMVALMQPSLKFWSAADHAGHLILTPKVDNCQL